LECPPDSNPKDIFAKDNASAILQLNASSATLNENKCIADVKAPVELTTKGGERGKGGASQVFRIKEYSEIAPHKHDSKIMLRKTYVRRIQWLSMFLFLLWLGFPNDSAAWGEGEEEECSRLWGSIDADTDTVHEPSIALKGGAPSSVLALSEGALLARLKEARKNNTTGTEEEEGTYEFVMVSLSSCPFSVRMKPIFQALSSRFPDIVFIDVDASGSSTLFWVFGYQHSRLNVRSYPTLQMFKHGQLQATFRERKTYAEVLQWLARHSSSEPVQSDELSEEQASDEVPIPRPILYYAKDYVACALLGWYLVHKAYLWFWLPRDTNPKKKAPARDNHDLRERNGHEQ
jgi:thiol-disulfide isomerase/thioredoxin